MLQSTDGYLCNSFCGYPKVNNKYRSTIMLITIKKTLFIFLFSLFFLEFLFSQLQAGFQRPVIDAKNEDRPKILAKISRYAWAKKTFDSIRVNVDRYADRHLVDTEWILSRMAMNWTEGNRYTSNRGRNSESMNLDRRTGNAPVPTPKVNTVKRHPRGPDGLRFINVSVIEQMPQYVGDVLNRRTSGSSVQHPSTAVWWWRYNTPFRSLARNAGLLYWLTREEKYAKLAADIFMQFIRGASYLERASYVGPDYGLLSMQTIDEKLFYLFQAYDFIHDYLMEHNDEYYYDRRYTNSETGYYPATGNDHPVRDTRYIDPETGRESIELMVDAFAYKFGKIFVNYGIQGNNWEMVETPYLATCALAITDRTKREDLIGYLLTKDRYNGDFGQQRISKQLKRLFNNRGLNREPLSYHNYPVSRYVLTIDMLENAGYNIMGNPKYSKIFKATYVVSDYLFPHGYSTSFGDADSGKQSASFLEVGYKYAKKYNSPEKDRIAYELNRQISKGYNRLGYTALLSYESVIEKPSLDRVRKKVSDNIDFASHYLQRNGGDNELEGLMYTIGAGGRYTHATGNGLTIELYGKGFVLGPDSGYGGYNSHIWLNYTSKIGSHNTVVVNELDIENWRAANLMSMDPPLGATFGVSANHSFSLSSFDYKGNQQRRSIMMNRTSENSGYYLDVFWSAGNKTDYLYHNLSGGVPNITFKKDGIVKIGRAVNVFRKTSIAYNWLKKQKEYSRNELDIQAEFKIDLNRFDENVYMKAWVMGESSRRYYGADTAYSGGVQPDFKNFSNAVMIIRDTSPNYNTKPFIVLYEPYKGDGREVIDYVRRMNGTKGQPHYIGIVVSNSDRNGQDRPDIQYLISSKDNNAVFNHERVQFKGYSATVSHNNGELSSLYLGKGSYLANYGYRLEKARNENISAYLKVEGQTMTFTSQNDTHVTITYRNNINRSYTNLGLYYKIKGSSEIRSATSQSIVPNDGVTTVGYGTITGVVPNTQTREVLLLPLEKRDYSGANASSTVKAYHNGRVSRRRVLFDNDSEISFLINSPTGFYPDTLMIKKDRQIFSADDYDIESIGFGEARVYLRNIADLDSGLHKVSFIVPGDGYVRKEYNVSLLRSTSSTRLVKVFPNPYKYGEHGDLKIEYFIPRNADRSEYILLIADVKGDEMDSVSMSAMSDNTGMAYWDTFRVRGNYGSGLYMIALMDKIKERYTIENIF